MRSAGLVLGCLAAAAAVMVAAPAAAEAPENPTFHKDIEPILQRSCQVCHRPNNMAPMSLMTYQETRPWARSIRAKVEAREMPPWHIDPKVGVQSFKDDKSLSDDEILTVGNWVQNGAPRGNPEDAPAPVEFQEFGAWTIEPDVIVTSPPHTVPAEAGDWWGDYIVPSGIPDDRYIKAIQTRAGDLRVVHHALTYAVTDPDALLNDSSEDAFLNEYAVGKNADVYPDGTGRLFPGDARVRFSFHYHSVGEEVTDQTDLGFVLYPEDYEPEHILYSRQLGQAGELDIPAGQVTRHDGYQKMYLPGKLTGFQAPHALPGDPAVPGAHLSERVDRDGELRELRLQLAHRLQLRGQRAAGVPGRHDPARDQLPRQHAGQPRQPRSEELDRWGQPHRRRDGLRLDKLARPQRGGVRGRARGQGERRQRLTAV